MKMNYTTFNSFVGKIPWLWSMLMLVLVFQSCQPEDPGPQIVIETGQIEEIGPTHCIIHGEIYETGLEGIKQHGFVWSDKPDPSLESGFITQLGTTYGPGTYSSTLRDLSPNTTYYVKAYGTGGTQSGYGMEKSFITSSPTVPSLYTFQAYELSANSAVTGGVIISDGGAEITSRGVCWSTTPTPSIHNSCTNDGTGSGSFESTLSDLEPYTVYFIRAYATNSMGTGYGENFGFITLWDNSPVEDIDGNEYATVQIGDQVWMAENLKAIHYSDGTPIAYLKYENSDSAFETYGALYTWPAAMDGNQSSDEFPSGVQGVCPDGWHMPSESEWKQLEYDLGMSELDARDDGWRGWGEGGMLKQVGTALWAEPNLLATNETGFSAIPAGFSDSDGVFQSIGSFTAFWSSTAYGGEALFRGLHAGRGEIFRDEYPQNSGLSVRCAMD